MITDDLDQLLNLFWGELSVFSENQISLLIKGGESQDLVEIFCGSLVHPSSNIPMPLYA